MLRIIAAFKKQVTEFNFSSSFYYAIFNVALPHSILSLLVVTTLIQEQLITVFPLMTIHFIKFLYNKNNNYIFFEINTDFWSKYPCNLILTMSSENLLH